MRTTAVLHSRFWHTLDWKNVLLLLVALCIIGVDLLGRIRVRQYSLGGAVNRVEETPEGEGAVRLPPVRQWSSPEVSTSWKTTRVEHSASNGTEAPVESTPPPGYAVTRVVPEP